MEEGDRRVTLERSNLDYINDYADMLYEFTVNVGYTYARQVTITKEDGETVSSVL
tara:strand:+ start:4769 stop:4933 length:165 start_codon:yes stop_codon:yes gene_type:complete